MSQGILKTEYSLLVLFAAATTEEAKTVLALMKRLSISAEDAERTAAISEVVALVKKGGVGALKVSCICTFWLFIFTCFVSIKGHKVLCKVDVTLCNRISDERVLCF